MAGQTLTPLQTSISSSTFKDLVSGHFFFVRRSLIIDYTLWTVSVINRCNCLDMWNVSSISLHLVSFSHPRDGKLIIWSPKMVKVSNYSKLAKKNSLWKFHNWLPINAIKYHRKNNLFSSWKCVVKEIC